MSQGRRSGHRSRQTTACSAHSGGPARDDHAGAEGGDLPAVGVVVDRQDPSVGELRDENAVVVDRRGDRVSGACDGSGQRRHLGVCGVHGRSSDVFPASVVVPGVVLARGFGLSESSCHGGGFRSAVEQDVAQGEPVIEGPPLVRCDHNPLPIVRVVLKTDCRSVEGEATVIGRRGQLAQRDRVVVLDDGQPRSGDGPECCRLFVQAFR